MRSAGVMARSAGGTRNGLVEIRSFLPGIKALQRRRAAPVRPLGRALPSDGANGSGYATRCPYSAASASPPAISATASPAPSSSAGTARATPRVPASEARVPARIPPASSATPTVTSAVPRPIT